MSHDPGWRDGCAAAGVTAGVVALWRLVRTSHQSARARACDVAECEHGLKICHRYNHLPAVSEFSDLLFRRRCLNVIRRSLRQISNLGKNTPPYPRYFIFDRRLRAHGDDDEAARYS